MAKKASQCHHFKVKFQQTLVFSDFSKVLLDENGNPKVTKIYVQPSNHGFLKIYQPIYIDHMGCIELHVHVG